MQEISFSSYESLRTERMLLRAPATVDRETLFFMRTDPALNKYIFREAPKTLADIDVFIKDRLKDRDTSTAIYWVLALKEFPEQYIGAISLWHFSEDRKTAEVGYDLHPEYQGKGFMGEALERVVDFGFNTLDLHMIVAHTHRENKPSRRLLEQRTFSLTDIKDDIVPTNIVYKLTKDI
ncbi:GNAT family N-acetyltransferase [Dokdonia sp.]|uniref:GNAT family N-acetyltransferase n=1 Tax=Dokdonia sp. TaxID=2024995 RepID=UPI003266801E